MFNKPVDASDLRESAFLQETAKLRSPQQPYNELYKAAQLSIIDRYLLQDWHRIELDILDHNMVAELT